MENTPSLFSPAEYLTTFTTFIYGYVATQCLSGWSSMITHRKSITFSKEHVAWTILTFVLLIDIWWTSWRKVETIASDNLIFYSSLLTPFVFYFLSHLFFPNLDTLPGHNLKTYLTPNTRKIMVTYTFLLISFFLSDHIFDRHIPQNGIFIFSGMGLTSALIILPAKISLRRLCLAIGTVLVSLHLISLINFAQPFEDMKGFSFVEYLTVFLTFIYGFVTYRFLEGWGLLITNFRKLTLGFDYVPWTILAFLLMLDMWWGTWAREEFLPRSILYFFVSLMVPILYYFMSAVMFPLELLNKGYVKLHHYYFQNNRIICLFLGLILLSNGIVSYIMEENELFSIENMFRLLGIGLSISGMTSSKLIYHRIVLILGAGLILTHAFTE
jgi:hypothetical protein